MNFQLSPAFRSLVARNLAPNAPTPEQFLIPLPVTEPSPAPVVPFVSLPPDFRPEDGSDSIFSDVFATQPRSASPEHPLLNDDTLLQLHAAAPEPAPLSDPIDERLRWKIHKPRTTRSRTSRSNPQSLAPDDVLAQPLPEPAATLPRFHGTNAGIQSLIIHETQKGATSTAIANLSPCRRVGYTPRYVRDVIYHMQDIGILAKRRTLAGTPREITDDDRAAILEHRRNGLRYKDIFELPQFAGRGLSIDQLKRVINAGRRMAEKRTV